MHFQKNNLVCFERNGKEWVGYIESLGPKKIVIVFFDPVQNCLIQMGNTPQISPQDYIARLKMRLRGSEHIPVMLKSHHAAVAAPKPRKGDAVAFEYEGRGYTGRVLKGGEKCEVSFNGGRVITGHCSIFSPAEMPEADDELVAWRIEGYKVVHGHDDSEPFVATVCRHGKPVLEVSDDGWGGGVVYRAIKGGSREDEKALGAALNEFARNSGESPQGLLDIWPHWDWYIRPTGKSFRDYMAGFARI